MKRAVLLLFALAACEPTASRSLAEPAAREAVLATAMASLPHVHVVERPAPPQVPDAPPPCACIAPEPPPPPPPPKPCKCIEPKRPLAPDL